jgi:hypothetical protein
MTIDTPPLANESAPREAGRNSRRAYRWIPSAMVGAFFAVLLLGAVVWLSTGLGLLHLMGLLGRGRTLFNVDQPTVVHQIQQLQRLSAEIPGGRSLAAGGAWRSGCGHQSREFAAERGGNTRAESVDSLACRGSLEHAYR